MKSYSAIRKECCAAVVCNHQRWVLLRRWLALLLLLGAPAYGKMQLTQQSNRQLIVSCGLDSTQVRSLLTKDRPQIQQQISQEAWEPSGPFGLPMQVLPLHIPAADVELRVDSIESEQMVVEDGLPRVWEMSLSEAKKWEIDGRVNGDEPVSIQRLGRMQGLDIWQLSFRPLHYDSVSRKLTVFRSLRATVRWSDNSESDTGRRQLDSERIGMAKDLGIVLGEARMATPPDRQNLAAVSASPARWKIYIEEDGWYRVTGSDLHQAGIDLLSIDVQALRLTDGSSDVPIYVSGWQDGQFHETDSFEFWGETARNSDRQTSPDLYQDPYSRTKIYFLSWSGQPGLWMVDESAAPTGSPATNVRRPYSFMQTMHVERDVSFNHLVEVPEGVRRDHFFFDGGIAAAEKRDYEFDLWHPDKRSAQPLQVQVMMRGKTVPSSTIDLFLHRVSAYLNNRYVMQGEWYGQDYLDMRTQGQSGLTGADLNSGKNRLTVINLLDPNKIDYVLLNWFEVTYPRLYRAQEGWLRFTIPSEEELGLYQFRIDGFLHDNIDVFKMGISCMVGGVAKETVDYENFASVQITFQDEIASRAVEYVAIARDRKKTPHRISPDHPSQLRSPDLAADYVVIAHRNFYNSQGLDELINRRQSQGLRVLKVDVEDIFDEFGDGRPTPEAIKAFLNHAYHHWENPRLRYVLLVGNGSRIRRTAAGDTLDFIPVYLRQTWKWGATASDYWYTLLDGDDELSDIAIGRLPARTEEECDILARKIVGYETTASPGHWRNRLLFIGGNFSTQAPFDQQALELVSTLSPALNKNILLSIRRRGLVDDPFYGSTTDLLDYFDQGCAIINFHGHGGGGIWADNGLLRTEDVARITNRGKLPFIMSMTCFSGAFESSSYRGLADALLFNTENGAVAFMGASGEGWVLNDYLLQRAILQLFDQNPSLPLGELIRLGKNLYQIANGPNLYVFAETNQYHLLGDPAMRLGVPQKRLPLQVDRHLLERGANLTAAAHLPFSRGKGYAAIVDSALALSDWREAPIQGGTASVQVEVPADFAGSEGHLVFYAEDELGIDRVHAAASLSLAAALFDSIRIELVDRDSSRLAVRIIAESTVEAAWCRVQQDSVPLFPIIGTTYRSHPFYYPYGFTYQLFARLADGRVISGLPTNYTSAGHIDLALNSESIRLTGVRETQLTAQVSNNSNTDLSDVVVQFEYFDPQSSQWRLLGRDKAELAALGKAEVNLAFAPLPGRAQVRVEIDPDSLCDRLYRYDNRAITSFVVDRYTVIPERGVVAGDSVLTNLAVDSTFTLFVGAGSVSLPTVLTVQVGESPEIVEQPDFAALAGMPVYRFFLADTLAYFSKSIELQFYLSPVLQAQLAAVGKPANVFYRQAATGKWVRQNSQTQGDHLLVSVQQPGEYTVLVGEDHLAPTVEMTIDGQPPIEQAYVQRRPRIGAILQDLNGIDLSAAGLQFQLDGRLLPPAEWILPTVITNGNHCLVEIRPELDPGQHHLQLTVSDCFGNRSLQNEFSFQVADRFELRLLGTYPNPFERETIFAYELTQPCEQLEIKIYTASGQLIRALDARSNTADANPLGADYHELLWDGRDEMGDSVANGVYFYRISVRGAGQTKEMTGKLMRLQ